MRPFLGHGSFIMLLYVSHRHNGVTRMQLFDGLGIAIALACGLLTMRVIAGV